MFHAIIPLVFKKATTLTDKRGCLKFIYNLLKRLMLCDTLLTISCTVYIPLDNVATSIVACSVFSWNSIKELENKSASH